jgi:thiamine-phosphate pyrophosphorylase
MDERAARVIDANFNRAREALRVVEDACRFLHQDAAAAAAAKALRHELTSLIGALGPDRLLAARDVPRDTGRGARTAQELQRTDPPGVLGAAFGRLGEALRTLAEFSKLSATGRPGLSESFERLRFAGYQLEQEISLRCDLRGRLRAVRLYVLVTAGLSAGPWLATAEAALRGGAQCLQLREKDLPDGELLARAAALRELTRRFGALLVINDRADVARLSAADGVHVGQRDLSVAEARSVAGQHVLVGKSTHDLEQVATAVEERPDYLAVGPMFVSSTKPRERVAGVELLAQAARRTSLPLAAIGGIDAQRAGPLISAGASCVCVCSAIIASADPESAARALRAAVDSAAG